MDWEMKNDSPYQNQNHPVQQLVNFRLLRFRSAPTSLHTNSLATITNGVTAVTNFESAEVTDATFSRRLFASNNLHPSPHYPSQNSVFTSSSMSDGLYRTENPAAMVGRTNPRTLNAAGSSLSRLDALALHDGYATTRDVGGSRVGVISGTNGEVSPSSTWWNGSTNYSPGLPSSLGTYVTDCEKFGSFSPGFAFDSWGDSAYFSGNGIGVKRDDQDEDYASIFSHQSEGLGNRNHILSHRLSLLKPPVKMAALEKKSLHYPDSEPCLVRAKRGCATHPRSIAERVRRSRISERMRKLQDLVPNMEKQTSTADMLEMAVEHIKDLQRQFKTLCHNRANCKCWNKQIA